MQSRLHKDGLADVTDSGRALPAGQKEMERKVEEEEGEDGDGGVGMVGWGEARM